MKPLRVVSAALALAAISWGAAALAGPFHLGGQPPAAPIAEIQQALDEQRLMDAGALIDRSIASGAKDPRLHVLAGELGLQRDRLDLALSDFRAAQKWPSTAAEGLQGEGIALARIGRLRNAAATLGKAVAMSPDLWRAWNALGAVHDQQQQWAEAAEAYEHAMAASGGAPAVLNNRGYSRLLQGKTTEATLDFVAALRKKPDLAEARTNLRLAIALKGDYSRSIAGADESDRAALLNNAGFAAAVRGDYAQAQSLLQAALDAHGKYYERAAENLKVVNGLRAEASENARN